MDPWFEVARGAAAGVTCLAVGIVARQLAIAKRRAQSTFEAAIVEQYRAIAAQLPLNALLGVPLDEQELTSHLRAFYEYFDLSRQQASLASRGRLRQQTWQAWHAGIEQHLRLPAFQQAWLRLAPSLDASFDDLKNLVCPELVMAFANHQRRGPACRGSNYWYSLTGSV